MNTHLIIENKEIELDETVQFAITKQFEDLSNPTTIINDWSKTISIPFTARNNAIFGHIYNPDRLTVSGTSDTLTGIYFDPYKKLDMRLQWGDDVLMVGYAKMNEVKQNNGKGTYEITLFGELGKVFQEMKKITFDTTTDDTDYLIHGEDYVNNIINKELIYDSWTHSGQTDNILRKCNDVDYNVHDIIGFAPNNSFSENFNYDTFQSSTTQSSQFTDVLGDTFKQATGIDPETAIPNGLLPREIGEYRSYLQLPYIYWNKLFQIFKEKSEEVTGYSFDLDNSWFNNNNPYWYNLVYMLNSFVYGQEQKETNRYELVFKNNNTRWGSIEYTSTKQAGVYVGYHDEGSGVIIGHRVYHMEEVIPMYDTNADTWSPGIWGVQINTNFTLKLRYDQFYKNSYEETKLGPSNGLKLSIVVRDTITSTDMSTYKVFVCASNYNGTIPSDVHEVIYVDSISTSQVENNYHWSYITFNIPAHLYMPSNTACTIAIRGAWVNTSVPFVRTDGSTPSGTNVYLPEIYLNQSGSYKDFTLTDKKRSGSPFILNDLWNKEFNLFDEVLKYCKMFRIGIQVDEFNKKIIFKPIYKYFDNYSILDWAEKVDKSKDFVITPITFENKYVLFNHDDNETKLGQMYKEKYGVNYGDYRLITEYNFNIETKKLFDKVKSPIVNTDNVISWDNLYTYHLIVYSMPAEISVYNKDKDNKQVNIFGSFYFHNSIVDFDTEEALHMRNVIISDDSQLQQSTNTFFYSQTIGPKVKCTTYPKLDIVRGDNMCVLNTPKENYTYLKNYGGKNSIYANFWKSYIDERYNTQNKIITCYVMLKPTEYNQFQWNKLVKVGNQLCIVNKIYDYDITGNQPTKVDLITIQDINGYTKNNYVIS